MTETSSTGQAILSDLGPEGTAVWTARISSCVRDALATYGVTPHLVEAGDARASEPTFTDWTAFPIRIAACLSRARARAMLDWRTDAGDEGRRRFQEEYAEWRVVRGTDGKIRRFELTTELPDYWTLLAGREPERTMQLLAQFANERTVSAQDIYGPLDPFADGVTDAQREAAFAQNVLGEGNSPYNNGRRAICCMHQPTNTLEALLRLVAAAARPHVVRDETSGLTRCANAAEVIPLLQGAAQIGRNSDPVLVERLVRLAFEGRLITFDGPVGVYIRGFQLERLCMPDGSPAPAAWVLLERAVPSGIEADGQSRSQRLSFEIPDGQGICVGDLVDGATGQPIEYGADLADLVQLAVHLRTSVPSVVTETIESQKAPDPLSALSGCDEVDASWREFHAQGE